MFVTVDALETIAVVIGVGRVVPNAPEAVIANGDCKDVATLMSALLAAKGIANEYALINTNPIYQLDETPQVGAFNHVIVYLPELYCLCRSRVALRARLIASPNVAPSKKLS
jgi:transglutaminase-like putative cysteine protease